MKVLLIDADSSIPNLALMKLSARHKAQGDQVSFSQSEPDRIYGSIVFKRNRHLLSGIQSFYPHAETVLGGSGYDLKTFLELETEALCPDYSLYDGRVCQKCGNLTRCCKCLSRISMPGNLFYSMGFTSRGCIRDCKAAGIVPCIVPEKEGRLYHNDGMRPEIWVRHRKVKLLDNNWYADQDWFFEMSQWFIDNKVAVDATQGMDIRLLTPEIAKQLKKLRWCAPMHFAFDDKGYEGKVLAGIQMLRDAGMEKKLRHGIFFYVFCNDDSQYDDAVARCRILKCEGTSAFVMFNCDNKPTPRIKRLQRWANRPWLFWSIDIDQYERVSKIQQKGQVNE